MRKKDWFKIGGLIIIAMIIPRIMLFYMVCGLLDFRRSNKFDRANWLRYFLGNGILTWILSPFNLLMDLLSHKNKYIYKLEELPEECQNEIKDLIDTAKNKPEIITELGKLMDEKKRGMIFFKWYGKNLETNLSIPEFHKEYKYINTIGVSIFNRNQSTSIHYGPLRITIRVLYNILANDTNKNDGVYIEVANKRHYWHDNQLFIFDDTLVHKSVNQSEDLRYCMFVDILRPSNHLNILKHCVTGVRYIMLSYNRIFYKNWEMIK